MVLIETSTLTYFVEILEPISEIFLNDYDFKNMRRAEIRHFWKFLEKLTVTNTTET
jgi:hypothetical protein